MKIERKEILKKLNKIYQKITDSKKEIKEEDHLKEDLDVTSISLLYMLMEMENEFHLDLSEISFDTFQTVKDCVDYLENHLK